MDPQQPNQAQPPPPPPASAPQYAYAPGYYQPPPERLTWKQKIVLGCVLFTLVVLFALWNSCHAPAATAPGSAAQTPGIYPSNPRTIESQRMQAQRELEAAQAAAAAAKARFENGPSTAPTATTTARSGAGGQNPDAEFWRQIRQEKWKREQEAPYASGVGFVTKQARDEDRERPAAPSTEQERSRETATASAPKPSAADPPADQIAALADASPTHVLDEGTILPATLLNQLDGEFSGPVICQISENVFDASGLDLLIPAGSKALGSAQSVNSGNQRRLAVAFHRIIMPDGYSLSLDKVPGLDQIGATALSGQVNRHYLQTFGMAAVVGAISGLAQIGNSAGSYSPFYGFREGVSQQTAASSEQILSHYLNRLPTIAIKPGSRVKLILTADISGVPEYRNHAMPVNR